MFWKQDLTLQKKESGINLTVMLGPVSQTISFLKMFETTVTEIV